MLSWGLFPRTYAPTQTCTVWDIQVCLLGPSHLSPSCLKPPLHPVCVTGARLSVQLLSPSLTGPPMLERSCTLKLSCCRAGVSVI